MNLVAIHLDETSLDSLMQTANSMQSQLLNDDLWLTRITVLTSLYPGAAHLERGAEESAYAWHRRYRRALVSASLMAEQNMRGDMPYMRMHGEFQSARFIAHTPLRLPAPYGLIAEVVRYAAEIGMPDPAKDGSLMFENAPSGADMNFRYVVRKVADARADAVKNKTVQRLATVLETEYRPRVAQLEPNTQGTSTDALATAAHREARERVVRILRRRCGHMSAALAHAHDRIAMLEARVAELTLENAQLRSENRALRAEVAQLSGTVRNLERELDERPTSEQLRRARDALKEERAARKSAELKLRLINLERARLIKQLRAAEADYEESEAELAKAQPMSALERELVAMQEREMERNHAAQLAALHHNAVANLQSALDAELASGEFWTPDQYVERARAQAAGGSVSPRTRKVAAVVMEATAARDGGQVTLPPAAGTSNRGRGVTYMQVVKHLKASDSVSPRELYRRTKELESRLEETSAGAKVEQLRHFIKSNKALMMEAMEGTWLSKPKSPSLDDLISLKAEMSGQMYDCVMRFIRQKCGVKTEVTRAEVKAAFDDFGFEYELRDFTSVDEKEVEGKDGKKVGGPPCLLP